MEGSVMPLISKPKPITTFLREVKFSELKTSSNLDHPDKNNPFPRPTLTLSQVIVISRVSIPLAEDDIESNRLKKLRAVR